MIKPYRFKMPRPISPARMHVPRGQPNTEGLTGFVQGKEASDLEERYARSLSKLGLDFTYEYEVMTAHSLPSEEKIVDYIVWSGFPYPTEIDGGFTHKSAEQKDYDKRRDALVDEALGKRGFQPIKRIDGRFLETQDGSDMTAKEMFG